VVAFPVLGAFEGGRVVGVRLAHGWGPDTSTPLVLLRLRAATGVVGIVSLPADLAQMLVNDAMTPR